MVVAAGVRATVQRCEQRSGAAMKSRSEQTRAALAIVFLLYALPVAASAGGAPTDARPQLPRRHHPVEAVSPHVASGTGGE